jgi:hypothetical protein
MTILTFPTNPTLGDIFVGSNSATYTWVGYWSSREPILSGDAKPVAEGGYAPELTPETYLDGGGA